MKSHRHSLFYPFGFIAALAISADPAPAQTNLNPGARTNALSQISALQAEARSLSTAQRKIATSLLDAAREARGAAPRPFAPKVQSGLRLTASRQIQVDIRADVTEVLLNRIKQLGGTLVSSFPQYQSIRAELPVTALETVAGQTEVRSILPADFGVANIGSVTDEGDVAHQANFVRNGYSATGAGVKVGVVSTSARYLSNLQSANDLGAVTILPGQSGSGSANDDGEGTAMMAIIHDLAPDAQLYFATGTGGAAAAASNVTALADAGCQIIVDDMTYREDSPFHENTPMVQAIKNASDRGILCFSSAANSGNVTKGTSGTWEGDFVSAGVVDPRYGTGPLLSWGGGNVFNAVTNNNSSAIVLYWSDPLGGSANDYNLFVVDGSGNVVNQSVFPQTGSQDPFEVVPAATNGQFIVVTLASGSSRFLHLDTWRGILSIGTRGSVRGHNAAGAANAFSVAAASALGRTTPFTGGSADPIEPFSSDGSRRIFYDTAGNEITPGNRSSTGGLVLQKPDITAADATLATTAFPTNSGFSKPFYGTSAAAPHAGAIAALLKSYRPDLTPPQIRAALMNTALDIEAAGFDRDSGAGLIMADRALASVAPTVTLTSPTEGSAVVSPATVSGTAADGGGISYVRIALLRSSDGTWYDFANNTWGSTTFDWNTNVKVAVGTNSWSAALPVLGAGGYQVQAQAVGVFTNASVWVTRSFSGDATAPVVSFSPLTNQQTIVNFSLLGGLVGEPSTVTFRIEEFNVGGTNRYWNGSDWILAGDSPSVRLSATVSGNSWHPASGTLPSRGQTRYGNYIVYVYAEDAASNVGENNIVLIRSAPDTTPPVVGFITPTANQVFTNTSLPSFVGTASDPETGVSTVSLLLYHNVNGNLQFWNGSSWQLDPFSLTASYGAGVWSFTSLPSGGNLPNGAYSVNVTAQNNEEPSGGGGLGITFYVDYHPVYVWTAGSWSDQIPGNENNNWENPANWDAGVPDTNGIAIINGYPTALGSTAVYAVELNGGALNTPGLLIHKRLNLNGGSLYGGMINLASNAVCNWAAGDISGDWNVLPGATLNLDTAGTVTMNSGSINNSGLFTWTNSGIFWAGNGTTLSNSAMIDLQGEGLLRYNNSGASARLINAASGTIRKISGTNSVFTGDYGGWIFENSGLIDVQTGTLQLWGTQNYLLNGGRITGSGCLAEMAGAVTITSTTTFTNGTFALVNGQLVGTGQFAGNGTFDWQGGNVNSGANLTVGSQMQMLLSSTSDKWLGNASTLNNQGTTLLLGPGQITISTGATFNNSGLFEVRTNATFFYDNSGAKPTFNNLAGGTFRKTTTNLANFHPAYGGITFNNSGQVDVQSGRLQFGGGGSSSGEFGALGGGEIEFTGQTQTLQNGASFTGAGVSRIVGGRINLNNIGSGSVTLNGILELANGGFFGGSGQILGHGTFNWNGGYMDSSFVLGPTVTMNISGSDTKTFEYGRLANQGTINWLNDGWVWFGAGARLTNSGLFNAQGTATLIYNNSGATVAFDNGPLGTLRKSGTTTNRFGPDYGGVALNNWGTLDVQGGVLSLEQSQKTFYSGGTISGAARLKNASGTLTLAGTTAVNGTFEWAAGAIIGSGGFGGTGTLDWSGGQISGAQMTNDTTLTMLISPGSDKWMGNAAVLQQNGSTIVTEPGNVTLSSGATFNNSGLFEVRTNATFFYDNSGASPSFNNQAGGTIRKTGSGDAAFSGAYGGIHFNNSGIIDLRNGNLGVDAPNTIASTAQLRIALAGTNSTPRETFAGNFDRNGALTITLTNGFIPTNGMTFTVATHSSASGQFSPLNLPALPFPLQWKLAYGANETTLTVERAHILTASGAPVAGQFNLNFNGPAASAAVLEASTNLVNWIPVQTNAPFTGTFSFVDLQATNRPSKFYRVMVTP